jgi:hypothetical protein
VGMPPAQTRPGPACPAPEDINNEIRRLMTLPPTPARTAEYGRLLWLWAAAAEDLDEAA